MPADLFSNFLGMTLQATGNNNNAWGTILNGSALQTIERAIAGNISRAVAGGTLDLSASPPPAAVHQALDFIQIFTGVLTSNQTVIMPNLSKMWSIINRTSGAFQLFVKTTGGAACQIPQGCSKYVVCDGQDGMLRYDRDEVGSFLHTAQAGLSSGYLACSGQSLLKADFPDLFTKIGTTYGSVDGLHFTLPNLQDSGRYLRSNSGSFTPGTYQSSQNLSHAHTITGAPGVGTLGTDNPGNHTHGNSVTDLGHVHSIPIQRSGQLVTSGTGTAGEGVIISPLNSGTNIGTPMSITNAPAGAHIHNITGAPTVGTLATVTNGGTEARPESLVIVIAIKY